MFQPAVVKPRIAPPPPPPAGNRPKPPMQNYVGARQVTSALFVSLPHTRAHVRVCAGADHLGLCCPGTEASPPTKGLRFRPAPQLSMEALLQSQFTSCIFLHVFMLLVFQGFIYLYIL